MNTIKCKITLAVLFLGIGFQSFGQNNNIQKKTTTESKSTYLGDKPYTIKIYPQKFKSDKPKNIILMIGDGMGVAQVFTGITANHGHLFLENFKHIGFSKTQSFSNYITDSAAGATALSAGVKTYNYAIGVDKDTIPVITILEKAEERGLATGMVSTSSITHATPASFIAHQKSRSMNEAIAADFLKTDIDVFIGGGLTYFTEREDGRNIADELKGKGYKVLENMADISKVKKGKLAGLTAPIENGRVSERGNLLPLATKTAINILKKDKDGFFLMVEGSQIDWGGHNNHTSYIAEEMLDFDRTIGQVLEFAAKDGETLIVITADHETGGLSILGGNMETGKVKGAYSTNGHTAVMVPIFAYGPGAENFMGFMENTDIHRKMKELLFDNQ
ncbi:alkaline phosphatase [Arenibacter sp. ARW7G5Y1]|uniref:alkaline phosphatase n=1 Tax=Arenibacter sp. ARW7G5Y1 TaxID=2135619 RepID=UPI000D9BFB37|nr:alkaline phosphatase [Arenibacter sp. ARW7G5Y1]PXX21836.1 alkaline phosphatase [Arenibacter sp. ARW7G5Y1]